MSETQGRIATLLCGLFGVGLLVGSGRSILSGEVRLRRYEAPFSEAWPAVLLLTLAGLALVVGSVVAWRRGG